MAMTDAGFRNWAGNYHYRAKRVHRPKSVEEVQDLVAGATKVKVLGTRHSFNGIADSDEDLIALDFMNRIVELDETARTVTIQGGVRYGELALALHKAGYALHNMASLPHISVAGACATATHGSGVANKNLAGSVSAMEFVVADGSVRRLSRGEDGALFEGAVVHLGGLGVITALTLDLVPTFEVRQVVYEGAPLRSVEQHFEEIASSAYSVSLFTAWRGPEINQIWLKQRVPEESDAFAGEGSFFGATRATEPRHPIAGISAEHCTEQLGIAGPWHERLPHFRMEFTPSSGEELQSEYFVPRAEAGAAIRVLDEIRDQIAPLLQISEIRTIAADDFWMSPCYQEASVAIHFTWKKEWNAVRKVLPAIEERLAPLGVRPHWGKLFTMNGKRISAAYERVSDFRRLLQSYDPLGKFRNEFLDGTIFGE